MPRVHNAFFDVLFDLNTTNNDRERGDHFSTFQQSQLKIYIRFHILYIKKFIPFKKCTNK